MSGRAGIEKIGASPCSPGFDCGPGGQARTIEPEARDLRGSRAGETLMQRINLGQPDIARRISSGYVE
jgi:hypothetical protein